MYIYYNQPLEPQQRAHLLARAQQVYEEKIENIRDKYHLQDDPSPLTPEEMVERINKGLYVIDPKPMNENFYLGMARFHWRDPKDILDKEGYDKAKESLETVYQDTQDAISVQPLSETLKALRNFQTKEF